MAYLLPDAPLTASRLLPAYEATRRPLLDRGIALGEPPDLHRLRRYLVARQCMEEVAAAEIALRQVSRSRWLRKRDRKSAGAADPELRAASWAVVRRGDRRDLEDAFGHRGLVAHAYAVNAASSSPAVCGFQPPLVNTGDARIARLAVATFALNPLCPLCLVALYESTLTGEADVPRWPTDLVEEGALPSAGERVPGPSITAYVSSADYVPAEAPEIVAPYERAESEASADEYIAPEEPAEASASAPRPEPAPEPASEAAEELHAISDVAIDDRLDDQGETRSAPVVIPIVEDRDVPAAEAELVADDGGRSR